MSRDRAQLESGPASEHSKRSHCEGMHKTGCFGSGLGLRLACRDHTTMWPGLHHCRLQQLEASCSCLKVVPIPREVDSAWSGPASEQARVAVDSEHTEAVDWKQPGF